MDLYTIIFYVFALIVVGASAVVVFSRNIVRAAFALLFTLFGVAGIYALLMADFLAVTQLLVYVGGILVLILFGVMLTTRVFDVQIRTGSLQTIPAVIIAGVLVGSLIGLYWTTEWSLPAAPLADAPTAPAIGTLFLTDFLLPFEIASVILLVALIGAAMIARRERSGSSGDHRTTT